MFGSFAVLGIAVLILGSTGIGRVIGSESERFLLYYAGVLVLLALTATVMIGLVATDRIIMSPDRRVTAQAVHRAVATGALAFLFIHIASEIAVGRSGPADTVIPFLDPGRTFYLGLGTVASDLMVMIAVTGIFRARLASNMSPLMWRLLHCTAYAAWVMGIFHGLLAGRPAKTFFDFTGFVGWSYGFCVAGVAIALAVRFVAKDRAAEQMIAQPVPDRPTPAWPAVAGAPALAQAAFGATPPSISPARPYQLALPAPPGAASARQPASLPAGRDRAGDSGEFGREETHAEYAYDGMRARSGADTRDHGQDGTRVHFGGDTRGSYGRDDTRVRFGDDPRGSSGRDDPRSGFGQAGPRGRDGRDDTRGGFGQGDTRVGYGRDDPRGGFGRDDPRGGFGQDDPRGQYGRDDPRRSYGRDETRGGFGRDDTRGQYARDDTRGSYGQDDTRGQYARDDMRGSYGQDDMRGQYGRDDTRGSYGQDDPRGQYGRDDMRGQYARDDTRGQYARDDTRGSYGQDDTRGQYARDDTRGSYGQDDTPAGYRQDDDPGGRYREDEASSFEEDLSDREATGPLAAMPFSRYGTRS